MKVVHFGEGACEKVRRYMDSYLSNELLVETNHELLRHLDTCTTCSEELRTRTRIRGQLKAVVEAQPVPMGLEAKIRRQIRSRAGRRFLFNPWLRYSVAFAAVLVMSVGAWLAFRPTDPLTWSRARQDSFISRISGPLSEVFRVGLGDHVHCSVFRKYPKNAPTLEQMTATLGPEYSGLLPIARKALPDNYRVVIGHKCGYNGRKFVHLSLTNSAKLVSVVLARKNPGESFSRARLKSALQQSGMPIYVAGADRFEIAGFETRDFLVYVVSDLSRDANVHLAANIAPQVREYLARLES